METRRRCNVTGIMGLQGSAAAHWMRFDGNDPIFELLGSDGHWWVGTWNHFFFFLFFFFFDPMVHDY